MKIAFVINPEAGKGNTKAVWNRLKERVKSKVKEKIIEIFSEYPGHIIEIVRSLLKEGIRRIVVVGGDGSLNEAINGAYGKKAEIGIIPTGSGNDFVKMLGFKKVGIKEYIGTEKTIEVDGVLVNNHRFFINIFGIGFEARVAKKMRESKFKGDLAYLDAVFKTLKEFKPVHMRINIDGYVIDTEPVIASAGNGRFHGGMFVLTPFAELNDGLIDFCIVKKLSKPKFLFYIPKAVKGTHYRIKRYVKILKGRFIKILCSEPLYYEMDGEVSENPEKEFVLKIFPKAFKILLPAWA